MEVKFDIKVRNFIFWVLIVLLLLANALSWKTYYQTEVNRVAIEQQKNTTQGIVNFLNQKFPAQPGN